MSAPPNPSPQSPPQGTSANLDGALLNISNILYNLSLNPQPTYNVDGKNIQFTEYFAMLCKQYEAIEKMRQRSDGPFEIRSLGTS